MEVSLRVLNLQCIINLWVFTAYIYPLQMHIMKSVANLHVTHADFTTESLQVCHGFMAKSTAVSFCYAMDST